MKYLSEFIVRRKKGIISFFIITMLISAVMFFYVPINYNVLDYLPKDANSTIAISKMEEEFSQPIPNLNVMVENISLMEAKTIKTEIEEADHVSEVIWLDDTLDLKVPLDMQDKETVESYYKDSSALFMVTVEEGDEQRAIESIREAVGKECSISGAAADQALAQSTASQEAANAVIILGPLLIVILILATTSWAEPLFFLITMGAAVLINLGTSYFLGDISFVTLAAAPVLQLAVSIDYVIFLLHSFNGYKEEGKSPQEAIKLAVVASGKSISASMLTTLFGFIALLFMQFRIGSDMGISLVKGVLLSFTCVMVLLPALLLVGSKWIDKTHHGSFLPKFSTMGQKVIRILVPVMILLTIIIIPSYMAQNRNEFFYGIENGVEKGSEKYKIEERFGKINSMVLLVPRENSTKEAILCEELEKLEYVTSIVSYTSMVSNKIPTELLSNSDVSQFYSDNYARIIISINGDYESKETFETVESIRNIAEKYYPGQHYTCGQSANMYDMKVYVEKDNVVVNIITMISIYMILAIMTKSWLLPIPLILTIKCSIWINMAIPYFMGEGLSYIGYLIVSTVQMGATVDYAILLTDKYMEHRKVMDKKTAMINTISNIFGSILISAITLSLSGFCLMLLSTNVIVKAMGELIGRGPLMALGCVTLLLPALILIVDPVLPYTTWKAKFYKEEKNKDKKLTMKEANK